MSKQSQKRTKRAALREASTVQHARQHHRLVGDDADRAALHAREAGDDVAGVRVLDLEEVGLVDDLGDQLLDVVGLVGVVRDQRVERGLGPVGAVAGRQLRHARLVVRRQEIEQPAHLQQRLDVVLVGTVGDRGLGGVHAGAAQLLGGDGLIGHRLHHVGAGDEHVARVLHHEDEVGHGRRVDVAAGAGSHDHRDLRDDAGGQHVAQEHLAVAAERRHAFLDARAAGVEQADDRRAVLQRHVLDLDDLLGVRLRQRAAEHREVLGENIDDAAVDGAPAGDHAVAGDFGLLHAEVVAAVLDIHVELLEGVLVDQQLDALAGGEFALACWASMRFCPPPSRASARRRSSSSSTSFMADAPRPFRRSDRHSMAVVHCEMVNPRPPFGRVRPVLSCSDDPAPDFPVARRLHGCRADACRLARLRIRHAALRCRGRPHAERGGGEGRSAVWRRARRDGAIVGYGPSRVSPTATPTHMPNASPCGMRSAEPAAGSLAAP